MLTKYESDGLVLYGQSEYSEIDLLKYWHISQMLPNVKYQQEYLLRYKINFKFKRSKFNNNGATIIIIIIIILAKSIESRTLKVSKKN